ncbi:MAG: Zn-ribbon containing protein [Candidatus Anstonellaceae archaeon]
MHSCARCGKQAKSIEEIHKGCDCGCKVFVFNKSLEEAGSPVMSFEREPNGGKRGSSKADGKAPDSYFARAEFSSEDVENVKIVSQGVFCLNINGLWKNPLVVKDEDGVYYVKIPLRKKD